jgi:hypothetical protein
VDAVLEVVPREMNHQTKLAKGESQMKVRKFTIAVLCALGSLLLMSAAFAQSPDPADHENHTGFVDQGENYAGPYMGPGPTVQEGVIVKIINKHNHCEGSLSTSVQTEEGVQHSWNVGGSVSTEIKNGMLTKVVAEGKVKVEVNGAYSGTGTKKIKVTDSTTLASCSCKKLTITMDRVTTERYRLVGHGFECAQCFPDEIVIYQPVICSGAGSGHEEESWFWEHLENYSQSTDPDKDCYNFW